MVRPSLRNHLCLDRYGDFLLTRAIRPGRNLPIVPRQGFRMATYATAAITVPVLVAAVSRERLFETFLALLTPLGDEVDVLLERRESHDSSGQQSWREAMERTVLLSPFCAYEELLLDDGCTGVVVFSRTRPIEVHFDEHKLLIIYARDLEPFEAILRQQDVPRRDDLQLITQGEHLHYSNPAFACSYDRLAHTLGMNRR
ncbi:MAG: hypothetical protein SNJ75_09030 [Gemmataceae bacterium]